MERPLDSLKKIHQYFIGAGESLCAAESCSGGLLSFWLTHLPGASKYFKGALISYQISAKIDLLGLDPEKIKKEGLAAEGCAQAMAQSVKNLLKADWALAITGFAGPSAGNLGEPAGKVAFSLSSPVSQKSLTKQFKGPHREDIRRQSALFALDLLISGFK